MASSLWPALEIQLPAAADSGLIELVLARLDDFQPTAIHETDTSAWRTFFSTSNARDGACGALISEFSHRGVSAQSVDVQDDNWAARSQAELHAVQVGQIVVAPPWDLPIDPPSDTQTIVIEPSVGFGTGHHPSTRLCLDVVQKLDLHGRRVLDIGTGSGVLAIAALRLGARHALAVDVDADALKSARENAARNGVEARIAFEQADFRDVSLPQADVAFANLTGAILRDTLDRLIDLAVPAGVLVLSGFTSEELIARPDGPVAASPRVGIIDQLDEDGWRCFVVRRR